MGGRTDENPRDEGALVLPEGFDARFRGPLMSFFTRRVGSRIEAEDLTQEVFLRLVQRHGVVSAETAEAFIFHIAANLLRDRARWLRRHRNGQHFSLDETDAGNRSNWAAELVEDRGPERVLLAQEGLAEVLTVLDELGERTRGIFILHRLEKMKYREIASLYGISASAVEKHIIKAIAYLAKRLKQP